MQSDTARRARPRGPKKSAGLLLFRGRGPEVLLAHPGGPFWSRKDEGVWTIPKGLIAAGETPLAAARREFFEETGHRPEGELFPLGQARQLSGKIVQIFAVKGDWDAGLLQSNSFEMEWPPHSGQLQSFPEIDRARWFGLSEARSKILKGQEVFLDRLLEALLQKSL